MKKKAGWSIVAMMALTLAGCGMKGPLYMPPSDNKPKVATTPQDSDDHVERNQQEQSGTTSSAAVAQ